MIKTSVLFFFFMYLGQINAQNIEIWTKKDSLIFWADVMLLTTDSKFRTKAAEEFKTLTLSLINEPNFNEYVTALNSRVAFIEPEDRAFQLLSWQYESASGNWIYDGLLRFPSGKIQHLNFEKRDLTKLKYETIKPEKWYGAMYYYLVPIAANFYTVFGFAQNEQGIKFRIIETLFIENEQVVFGKEVFKIKESNQSFDYRARIVIPYSQESTCALTFDGEKNQIVHDYITAISGDETAEGKMMLVADGTMDAYEFINNQWVFIGKLENQILDEAPREKPVLGGDKDILGRPKKGKK
ncbi:MAG: hypothetical protein M3Q56_05720 [Bacteroidota bacterium]|nr:hypothetical protein [Bacteroidota bacterium]